jgi:NarL family two-component system response regulator LiaR
MVQSSTPDRLTRREREILLLLAQGKSNRQIARETDVSVRTVKFHTGNIYSKLRLASRSEAIAWAWRHDELRRLLQK